MGRVSGGWPAGDGAPRPPSRKGDHLQGQRQDLSHPSGQKRGNASLREEAATYHFCAYQRPERNSTPGSRSTAKLVPLFAAADNGLAVDLQDLSRPADEKGKDEVFLCTRPVRPAKPTGSRLRTQKRVASAVIPAAVSAYTAGPGLAGQPSAWSRWMIQKRSAEETFLSREFDAQAQ